MRLCEAWCVGHRGARSHAFAVSSDLKEAAVGRDVRVSGPVRLPTKFLRLTVRKSPCGEGTNTWDRFEMRIHKRIIDLHTSTDMVKQVSEMGSMLHQCLTHMSSDHQHPHGARSRCGGHPQRVDYL